jgi:hypothetical protein
MDRERPIRLQVTQGVEIDSGLLIPPGIYPGIAKQAFFIDVARGAVDCRAPEYKLELTADQIVAMGGKAAANFSYAYDVTRFVNSSQILVI